ncbi:hypothetical protein J7643_06420 [bacterium]|nr:hypothetical protein [bacterium]
MCYFITATLPKATDLDALRPIIDAHKLKFKPIKNAFIEAQLPEELMYLQATKHYCDCETVGGCFRRLDQAKSEASFDTKKLKQKGWSDAKIARWIEEKNRTIEKQEAKEHDATAPAEWISFFQDLANTGLVNSIGLLIHFYTVGLMDEPFTIKGTAKINLQNLTPQLFRSNER